MPTWYSDYSAKVAALCNDDILQNIEELMNGADWIDWKHAIQEELDALHQNNT